MMFISDFVIQFAEYILIRIARSFVCLIIRNMFRRLRTRSALRSGLMGRRDIIDGHGKEIVNRFTCANAMNCPEKQEKEQRTIIFPLSGPISSSK